MPEITCPECGAEFDPPETPIDSDDVRYVWGTYLVDHPAAKLTKQRRDLITRRLKEGFTADDLCEAIRGNHLDDHCNGFNDRRRTYHALELILRNADKIEGYIEISQSHAKRERTMKIHRMLDDLESEHEVADKEAARQALGQLRAALG